jgi:hypothetical protein
MRRSILFLYFFILNSYYAQASCYVDLEISCQLKKGDAVRPLPFWKEQSESVRQRLYQSSEVQNSPDGCWRFTDLLRDECGLSRTIQANYFEKLSSEPLGQYFSSNESLSIKPETMMELPVIFQDYISGKLALSVNSEQQSKYNQVLMSSSNSY